MVQIDKKTSYKISYLGWICACLVVMIHVPIPAERFSSGWFLSEILSYGVCLIAVPFFFIVSGFFLGRHIGEKGWWLKEVKKRITSLLIPFFIFNFLYWLIFDHNIEGLSLIGLLKIIIGTPFGYPTLGPLWYVRSLFLYVVLSIILSRLSCGGAIIGLWIISLVFLLFEPSLGDNKVYLFLKYTVSLQNMFYFVLGIYLSNHGIPQISKKQTWGVLMFAVLILLAKLFVESFGGNCSNAWRVVFCPLLLIAFYNIFPLVNVTPKILKLAFPVFLLHYFMLIPLSHIPISTSTVYGFALNYLIMLGGAIGLNICIKVFCPAKVYKILFGNRC